MLRAAAPGWSYVLEASSDLFKWADSGFAKVGLDGKATFPMINALASPQFFRARLLP